MKANKFSPSVNIIRDKTKQLEYFLTPNAEKIVAQISNDFKKGFHSFTLIGSYGTGKSSFLWAFQQSLIGKPNYFKLNLIDKSAKIGILNLVGEFQSISGFFTEQLEVKGKNVSNQHILDSLFQEYEKYDFLLICIDEFGKFLEYASKNNPEKEMYFIQELAEFVNDSNRNIMLLTTLHQGFEAYSRTLIDESQRQEWRKVKGRYKELTFNEPVEQLLYLASKKFENSNQLKGNTKDISTSFLNLISKYNLFNSKEEFLGEIANNLIPLEPIAAYVLTLALQQFGQNERSLFTFLESQEFSDKELFHLEKVYDYLVGQYYSQIISPSNNSSFRNWTSIQAAIEQVDDYIEDNREIAFLLVKAIGLLQLYSKKSSQISFEFLDEYSRLIFNNTDISTVVKELVNRKIIFFTKYNKSYKIAEGTDLDFDVALLNAGKDIDSVRNIVPLLLEHFDFPVITAKAISYKTGTPRLFEFLISEEPLIKVPEGAVDGYINLIFNEKISVAQIKEFSIEKDQAIIYGYFNNTEKIKNTLFEIQKAKKVIADNYEDLVARKELEAIKRSNEQLLSHYVIDALYSDKVEWIFKGELKPNIKSKRSLNNYLSEICESVYSETPIFINELVNKQKISASIHSARKNYFEALAENWDQQDLGFSNDKYPAEKTIYISLLRENGMHLLKEGKFELAKPNEKNGFQSIWDASEAFLSECKREPVNVTAFVEKLAQRPYKLKLGLIDFWIPTFLFIKRGDFALYRDNIFIPTINKTILYEITRNPQDYSIKAFEFSEIRLRIFNKYREFLKQGDQNNLTNEAFIETIRPFLTFYRDLPIYSKNTKKLSLEALALRDAIVKAQDPEKTFFEAFPTALRVSIEQLSDSDEALTKFARVLNEAVNEVKEAYNQLLSRIETFIQEEIINKKVVFAVYKKELQKKYSNIKEHKLLKQQKMFLQRLNSPIDDRDSWIASISQAILQKPLDQLIDEEEDILKDKLEYIFKELDNLRDISKISTDHENVFKLEVTTFTDGLKTRNISIPSEKEDEVNLIVNEVQKVLAKNDKLTFAVIAKILQQNLK